MANYSVTRAAHKTLGAGVSDTVTLGPEYDFVEVYNRSTTAADTITAVQGPGPVTALADDAYVIPAGQSRRIPTPGTGDDNTVITLISSAAAPYSVTGVPLV